jgi:hypothetical protein
MNPSRNIQSLDTEREREMYLLRWHSQEHLVKRTDGDDATVPRSGAIAIWLLYVRERNYFAKGKNVSGKTVI